MTAVGAPGARRSARVRSAIEVIVLALVAYVPFLLSSRRLLVADSKAALYLDPARFLDRLPYLWDPQLGMGTVPHQQLGFLFPIGPYYWLMDAVGVPDWIAQRLWLGTLSFAAVLGARWLFRTLGVGATGALVGALVYVLTPYQLAFSARISVLLLPWAALPWLVALVMRATRRGGWRDPAWFALVVFCVGGINASSLLLIAVGPGLWVALELTRDAATRRRALAATARIALLTFGVSLWWLAGLRIQGAYGLPVLQLTESLQTVSVWSLPTDLLRGIGNWFFYGYDSSGFSIDQAGSYLERPWLVAITFAIPVIALAAAACTRWRHRTYFALMIVVATVIGVGAWPYDDPSPYGRLFKVFAEESSAGLAFRNTPRVVPVIVLGLAGLLAAGVGACATWTRPKVPRRTGEVAAGVLVAALAFGALAPVWRTGFLSDGVSHPEDVPAAWTDAARVIDEAAGARDEGEGATRVLEIPGADFAAYRWGNTIDSILPSIADTPSVVREVLPSGSEQSVNLLVALDHRIQEGTFEPSTLAPVARFMGADPVLVRSDLQYERFDLVRPRVLWFQLTEPLPPGIAAPVTFGDAVPNTPPFRIVDELELGTGSGLVDPPPVALFGVEDAVPIVHTAPTAQPVVLAGDGDGIVDASAAGLLDGQQVLFTLASLDDATLRRLVRDEADLVLTDSNRRRSQRWFAGVRDNTGGTERAGQDTPGPARGDYRLDVFPDSDDDSRTVVEQHGGRVDGTAAASAGERPSLAFDGDDRTAWRVDGDIGDGQRIVLRPEPRVLADEVVLVQPQTVDRGRFITRVKVTVNGREELVDLGPESLTPTGQVVPFPATRVRTLTVEPLATNIPAGDIDPATDGPLPSNAVGFAEVRLADVVVRETVRLPVDLDARVGDAADHSYSVVMTRLRYGTTRHDRPEEELSLDRRFLVPSARAFGLSGTARIATDVADVTLDRLLGATAADGELRASGHLKGSLDARASRAFDEDPTTAWTSPWGSGVGQWIEVARDTPTTVDGLSLGIVADGLHTVPTQVTLVVDGVPGQTVAVPPVTDLATAGASVDVALPVTPVTGSTFRIVVDAVREGLTDGVPTSTPTAPVAFSEVALAGAPVTVAPAGTVDSGCRSDLLRIDDTPVPLRITGNATDARDGLQVAACGITPAITLDEGSATLRATKGLDTGIDLDRITLTSAASGRATPARALGTPLGESGASVAVDRTSPTGLQIDVRSDGEPFWLVFGESANAGWSASVDGGSASSRQVASGYANAWLVTPDGEGAMSVSLRWEPQRLVWIALALSVLAALACVVLVLLARRRRRLAGDVGVVLADGPTLFFGGAARPVAPTFWPTCAVALGVGVVVALVSRPWIGAVCVLATVVALQLRRGELIVGLAAALSLAIGRGRDLRGQGWPESGWLAIGLLLAAVVASVVLDRVHRRRAGQGDGGSERDGRDDDDVTGVS